jgi:hypothetical protein
VASFCKSGDDLSGSMKGWEFHDQLSDFWCFKKDPHP